VTRRRATCGISTVVLGGTLIMTNVRYELSSEQASIVLDGRVDIRNAVELQRALIEAVGTDRPVVVDCLTAEWLDTSCMQLILAAHRGAPGRVTVKAGAETTVRHWLEQSGFAGQLTLA
jgi:anti-anti-sigma regulatory factor